MKKIYIDFYRRYGREISFFEKVLPIILPPQIRYFILLRKYQNSKNKISKKIINFKAKAFQYRYQLEIPLELEIGEGILMYHLGNVAINRGAKLGKNITLSPGVVIGHTINRDTGVSDGSPKIGDNCWIGQNVAIVGNISIGHNVLIAPNTYINRDIPENSICFGNPAIIKRCDNPTKYYGRNKI